MDNQDKELIFDDDEESDEYTETNFDEDLDNIYEPYKIGELVFYPSKILKELDPIAYQTMFNDWSDAQERN